MRVPRGGSVHALSDGSVLARSDFGNRALSGDEIRGLLSARANGDFEAEAVPGARIADLDPALLAAFMVARAKHLGRRSTEDVPLDALGAITPDHGVTVAGLLLFGRAPARWLPQAGVQFTRYLGPAGDAHLVFERSFAAPLAPLLDQVWETVREQMRAPSGEPDALEYPAAAVREVLANAVCHRDYRLRERITVRVFADCLEVTSPGGLPAFLTTAHLVEGATAAIRGTWRARRPVATRAGWRRRAAHPARDGSPGRSPAADRDGAVYRHRALFNECAPEAEASAAAARRRSQRAAAVALAYVRVHGSITFHELRALHPALRPDLLQRDLTACPGFGHLEQASAAQARTPLPP